MFLCKFLILNNDDVGKLKVKAMRSKNGCEAGGVTKQGKDIRRGEAAVGNVWKVD